MLRRLAPLASVAAILVLAACTSETDDAPECAPDPERWESEIAPLVATHCGTCHADEPDFGAPFALTDYHAITEGAEGERIVDRMVVQLVAGSMPPVGMPRPPDDDAQAIADWASCGEATVPPATGLSSSAPVFLAPDEAPAGLETVDLTAPEWEVGPDVLDLYQCFVFDAPVDEARFIRRFEMIIDESRVLHHVVFLRDTELNAPEEPFVCYGMPEGSDYLYAWAPGQGAVEFPEGGLRVEPGERFVMQIHYNNGAGVEDVRDSSGVRLYLAPPEGTEYGMLAVGPLDFVIPARSVAEADSECTFSEQTTVIAGMPHMHEIGSEFHQHVLRESGLRQPFIDLTGWSFETQLFYSTPVTFEPGDKLYTKCTWDNPFDHEVESGVRTSDEMCFNFMYVTPPPAGRYCDERPGDAPDDVEYVPGECAPTGAVTDNALVTGRFRVGALPDLAGGTLADGRYELIDTEFWTPEAETPLGTLDVLSSFVLGRGQLIVEGGHVVMDVDGVVYLKSTGGLEVTRESDTSISGDLAGTTSPGSFTFDCPADDAGSVTDVDFEVAGDRITIGFRLSDSGVEINPRYTFELR